MRDSHQWQEISISGGKDNYAVSFVIAYYFGASGNNFCINFLFLAFVPRIYVSTSKPSRLAVVQTVS
jgi:hypothetical protein